MQLQTIEQIRAICVKAENGDKQAIDARHALLTTGCQRGITLQIATEAIGYREPSGTQTKRVGFVSRLLGWLVG